MKQVILILAAMMAVLALEGCVQPPKTEITWGNFHAIDTSDKQALSGLTADVTEADGTHIVIGIKDLARDATSANAAYMTAMAQIFGHLIDKLPVVSVPGVTAPATPAAPSTTVIVAPAAPATTAPVTPIVLPKPPANP